MSVKSSSSLSEQPGEVVRLGYLKKLKTMRKKFFVLRAETLESSPRLEYYDNEKKYKSGLPPKRSISLKACFNINKRVDTKHKHVIALYTKDDCFCVVLDNEKELDDWLKVLLSLQHAEDVVDGEIPKPTFEHVWQVTMLNKGLGNSRNIIGPYHLCFTDKTLSLVRKTSNTFGGTSNNIGNTGHPDHVEFSLMSIRRCGHSECFFYMEVGRSAVTGAGELWMQTEDPNIAQNMNEVILRAMSNNNKEDLAPKPRIRSSSANEASKPILVQRRQTHSGQKTTSYISPNQDGGCSKAGEREHNLVLSPHQEMDSKVSVGYSNISTTSQQQLQQQQHTSTAVSVFVIPHQRAIVTRTNERRHSVSASGAISWSGIAHHQRTQSLPLAVTPAPTPSPASNHHSPHATDNNNPCYLPKTNHCNMVATNCANIGKIGARQNNNSSTQGRCLGVRDRCDSMPSRARTSSEGTPFPHPPRAYTHLTPHRPQSLYSRDLILSHSPPMGSPVSPASAACSTDSAGSSLSIDEPDAWGDYTETPVGRYGCSLTPDEPIVEENEMGEGGCYVPMALVSSDDGYVDMSPRGRLHNDMSPAASSCSITSGTPSTDMRFSEYHLEKVSSYFTPSEEDDTSSAERPLRAYSVGSRPDILKLRGTKPETSNENSRVRAFSVGSRTKCIHNRVLPPHGHPPSTGGKSSSAPLLSGSQSQLGSQNSMERMDDLMEMDFSKPTTNSTSGYVDMSPRNRIAPSGYVEMKPGVTETTNKDYLDMRPTPKLNPYYVEMSGKLGSSPKNNNKPTSPIQEEYMDMNFKSPLKSNNNNNEDYMNMSGPAASSSNSSQKKSRKSKTKARSQPIAILPQNNTSSFASFLQNPRKNSSGTPPKPNFLPLTSSCSSSPGTSPFSSLRRPRSRKNSRRDSKETPTSESSTIFPFSPGSPIKPFQLSTKSPDNNKCAVDASSGTVKLTNPDYTEMNFEKVRNTSTSSTQQDSDYVNYCPSTSSKLTDTITKQVNSINLKPCTFKPITEPSETILQPSKQLSRPSSVSSELGSTSSTIINLSRPASVNAELLTRPPSVSSEREIHYASLDLVPSEDDGTKSPRTSRQESNRSPTPNLTEPTFTYAEIDFIRSEGMKNNSVSSSKVKH